MSLLSRSVRAPKGTRASSPLLFVTTAAEGLSPSHGLLRAFSSSTTPSSDLEAQHKSTSAPKKAAVAAGLVSVLAAFASRWKGQAPAIPSEEERFRDGLPRACFAPGTKRFINPWLKEDGQDPCLQSPKSFIKLLTSWDPKSIKAQKDAPEALQAPRAVEWQELRSALESKQGQAVAVWLGHATVLCALRGKLILCDPVFSERCSPFSFAGPKRLMPSPVSPSLAEWPDDLVPDAILISHAHYDHLDEASVKALQKRFPDAKFLAPLGLKAWFDSHSVPLAAEMDWWQENDQVLGLDLGIVFLPSQHWANRWPWDRNETLWGGYGVLDRTVQAKSVPKMPFYFAGDTGYCPVFKQIGKMYDVGLAAVPIGAYEPRWFMSPQHCDPEEAVSITADLDCDKALAIHWGTFPLTFETSQGQLEELKDARSAAKDDRLVAVQAGGAIFGDKKIRSSAEL